MRVATAVAILGLLPALTWAQSSPPLDEIGIFADPGACFWCATPPPYVSHTAYLVALNPSDGSGITGWECTVYTSPDPMPVPWTATLAGAGTNELTPPRYRVALPAALPWDGAMVLASFTTFYLGGPLALGLGPCEPSNLPGSDAPAYRPGSGESSWHALVPWTNQPVYGVPHAYWVYGVNGFFEHCGPTPWCAVPAEPTSWGSLKRLYE